MTHPLYIQPDAGLANRMRALDSGYELAERLGVDLIIIWQEAGMQCRFERLFVKPPIVRRVWDLHRKTKLMSIKRDALAMVRSWQGVRTLTEREALLINDDLPRWRQLLEESPLYVSSCERFFSNHRPYRAFELAPNIAERVDRIVEGWRRPMIGVHIRRTDNIDAIERSPTSAIIAAAERRLAAVPGAGIFLATDDDEEERAMIDRFGEQIVLNRKTSRNRKDPQAIEEALIDMMCLARTLYIIGCSGSSFSAVAATYGGIDLEQIGQVTTFLPGEVAF